ncbi:MAG: S8 family serine peptidase [Gemmatimonadetes bacterium]|nr:S8 family serine peptidase [Gemmatimonadota bacterium]
MRQARALAVLMVAAAALDACASSGVPARGAPAPAQREGVTQAAADGAAAQAARSPVKDEPVLAPQVAFLAGLMPVRAIGADTFRLQRPTADGRGVIIGILDSGLDPGLPGFRTTTTGQPKLLDLRDFSGEGRVELSRVVPGGNGSVQVRGHLLRGFGRVARLAAPPYYAGVIRELPLGELPASDLNANGRNTDEYPLVVAQSSTGWFVLTDTNADGSLEDETPLYDFSVSGQVFTYTGADATRAARALALAVNLAEEGSRPVLDFFFDNSGHGSHVAGIAAGHNLFGVNGFDGVAPGAQVIGAKISNNARGGISVTGSMLRAMNYAADFAERRGLPLVLNLSFGVGNETEGTAAIDSLVDEFALKHPGVLFVISAGNDGPGISTVGFPGSADFALTACALFPGVFAQPPDAESAPPPDVIGWWSARGGELAKPDVCTPGVAFSNVPPWHTGEEISGGTSMAAPQLAGAAALLQSALLQQGGRGARAVDLKRALMATARPLPGGTAVEAGAGVPNVSAAYQWLVAGHQAGLYRVRAAAGGGNLAATGAAYRRAGLGSSADTIQQFVITSVGGQPSARLLLTSDASWLRAPAHVDLAGAPATISLTYDARALGRPGLYVGSVWARSATDTLAGPVLGLVNTIVVPRRLREPFRARETLAPGRVARHFVDVPEGAGGLSARLSLPDRNDHATLYLFEPDGKPHRGGGSTAVGGKDSTATTIRVNAEDVVPGVYEVVVLAPPNAGATYVLDLAIPRIAIAGRAPGQPAAIRNQGPEAVSSRVSVELAGAVRDTTVSGSRATPWTVNVRPPRWADRMVVEVDLPRQLWGGVTDFGITVFDGAGQQLSQGPMNYAFARETVKLDSLHRDAPLVIELYPAFAHLRPPEAWSARVRIAYLPARPAPVATSAVTIFPGSTETVSLPAVPGDLTAPEGVAPLARITVRPADGVPSVRESRW